MAFPQYLSNIQEQTKRNLEKMQSKRKRKEDRNTKRFLDMLKDKSDVEIDHIIRHMNSKNGNISMGIQEKIEGGHYSFLYSRRIDFKGSMEGIGTDRTILKPLEDTIVSRLQEHYKDAGVRFFCTARVISPWHWYEKLSFILTFPTVIGPYVIYRHVDKHVSIEYILNIRWD